jgi:hypothetical protein
VSTVTTIPVTTLVTLGLLVTAVPRLCTAFAHVATTLVALLHPAQTRRAEAAALLKIIIASGDCRTACKSALKGRGERRHERQAGG